jgi:hypothetical protein
LDCDFTIPQLDLQDLNGDRRDDVIVADGRRRAFHLQRPDGSIPPKPDVEVDLKLFRDTTPPAAVRPGRTFAGSERPRMQSRDLDGDGIPDYVIAHARKVWVFQGSNDGPQFTEPSTILKTADDVTALLLARLDDDPLPDLLILRVQVPTFATLVLGMLGDWDVEITAAGYENQGRRSFATTPKWRRELTLSLPSVAGVLRNPEALIRRIEEAGRNFRPESTGDFNGDGHPDLALLSEDGARLDVWSGQDAGRGPGSVEDFDRLLRRVLFEDPDSAWNIDRLLSLLGGLAAERVAHLTGGRPATATLDLRKGAPFTFSGLASGDLDGDGRSEIVVAYADSRRRFGLVLDVFGF